MSLKMHSVESPLVEGTVVEEQDVGPRRVLPVLGVAGVATTYPLVSSFSLACCCRFDSMFTSQLGTFEKVKDVDRVNESKPTDAQVRKARLLRRQSTLDAFAEAE